MKVVYDDSADAVYIQLVDEIGAGGAANTYPCDPAEVGGLINLDFDAAGHLVGIEVLDATSCSPPSCSLGRRSESCR